MSVALGAKIRTRRKELRMEVTELAAAINRSGPSVSRYERGEQHPRPRPFRRLLDALRVPEHDRPEWDRLWRAGYEPNATDDEEDGQDGVPGGDATPAHKSGPADVDRSGASGPDAPGEGPPHGVRQAGPRFYGDPGELEARIMVRVEAALAAFRLEVLADTFVHGHGNASEIPPVNPATVQGTRGGGRHNIDFRHTFLH